MRPTIERWNYINKEYEKSKLLLSQPTYIYVTYYPNIHEDDML